MPTLASCPLSASNSADSLPSGAARSRSASSTACFVLGMKKPWVEPEQEDDRDEAPADEEAAHPVGAVGGEVDPGEQDQGHRRGVARSGPRGRSSGRPTGSRRPPSRWAVGDVGAVGEGGPEADHHRGDVEEDDDAVERDRCCDHGGNASAAVGAIRALSERSRSAAQSPLGELLLDARGRPPRKRRRRARARSASSPLRTIVLRRRDRAGGRSARRAGSGAARSGWPSRSPPAAAPLPAG